MKINKLILIFLLLITNSIFCQKVTLDIKNSIKSDKLLLKTLTDDILKTIYIKSEKTDANIDVEEGYYLLKQDENEVLLYLKRTDDFTINFDAENFYESIVFKGKGAERNTFLLRKKLEFLNDKGSINTYYKRDFYKGDENEYLNRLDEYYKGMFGNLFSNRFHKNFVDAEMKNLQYGYSLDILKFEGAKVHYAFNDSTKVSSGFLKPLNHIHFDKSELIKRYLSYKELAILKWKIDIQKSENIEMMQDVLNSIRTESLKQAVLESLCNDIHKENPLIEEYYRLIIENSFERSLKSKAKEKYSEIKQVDIERNLSKFKCKTIKEEKTSLAQFKGNYIFISFWMSNCKTCLKTFKDIEKLKKKYRRDKIVFVGISLDSRGKYNSWKKIIQENNIEDNQLFFTGSKAKVVEEFNISVLPSYAILSLGGDIIETEIDSPISKETKRLINKLLKKK